MASNRITSGCRLSSITYHSGFKHFLIILYLKTSPLAARLQYDSAHGSDSTFIQVTKAVPTIAHVIRDSIRNSSVTWNIQHQYVSLQMQQIRTKLDESLNIIQPLSIFFLSLINRRSSDGYSFHR
jgi:hypothetical protein